MKNNFIIFCSLIVTIFSVLSCTDDNKTVNTTEFTLNTTLPEGFEEPSISNMVVKFTNVNTGRVTNNTTFENNQIHVTLPEGMYHISMEGFIQYKREGESHEGLIRGYEESVNISGTTASLATELFISQTSSDFIIAEIFYTGTVTEEGQQYNGDKYIKIYNNTDKVLCRRIIYSRISIPNHRQARLHARHHERGYGRKLYSYHSGKWNRTPG